jgi:hypothetical protein
MAKPKLCLVNEEDLDAKFERERMEAIEAFSLTYADYLEAQARTVRPSRCNYDRLDRELSEARSRVMALPARSKFQIGYKFAVLRDLIANDTVREDLREVIDSIESDMERGD